ncbi:hypothetical protein Holit_00974 [Hollandina sp. SP2]
MLANISYRCMLDGTFGYDHTGDTRKKLDNKGITFSMDYAVGFSRVQIECYGTLRIIQGRDVTDTFLYLDFP